MLSGCPEDVNATNTDDLHHVKPSFLTTSRLNMRRHRLRLMLGCDKTYLGIVALPAASTTGLSPYDTTSVLQLRKGSSHRVLLSPPLCSGPLLWQRFYPKRLRILSTVVLIRPIILIIVQVRIDLRGAVP